MKSFSLKHRLSLYLKLIRFNKPIGSILLTWPCLWGIAQAYHAHNRPLKQCLYYACLLTIGAVIMRSLGCVINDIADRHIDGFVERTKTRPIAAGDITLKQARVVAFFIGLLGLIIFLSIPTTAKLWASIGGILLFIYPYMKRLTYYPQVVLGLAYNTGVLVGYSCLVDTMSFTIICLYLCGVFFTIAYDTIYAFQDSVDDKKIGVKSTAIRFEGAPKVMVGMCYVFGLISLVLSKGQIDRSHIGYAAFAIFIIKIWNPNDQQSCNTLFKAHAWGGFFGTL